MGLLEGRLGFPHKGFPAEVRMRSFDGVFSLLSQEKGVDNTARMW